MEPRAHHVIIGLFTLTGLLMALSFGVWLMKSGQQHETRTYRVIFEEAVTGLSVGSLVQYSGLRVGEVSRLQLDPTDPRRVWADVEVNADTPINQGTRARMVIANITGAANIMLNSDDPQAPPLVGNGDEPPVLIAEPSPIGALMGSGEALLSGVNELVVQGTDLLSPENIDRIGQILRNLELLSETLAQSRSDLSETLQALSGAATEARTAMREVRTLIDERGEPLLAEGHEALQSLAQSSRQLERLLSRNAGAVDQGLQGIAEVGPVMRELRRSLGTLNRILSRLEEDPAGYLSGKAPVREFTP